MKRIAKALACILAVYLLISALLSTLYSFGICGTWIVRNRAPFLLVDVAVSTVVGNVDADQYRFLPGTYGYDHKGWYIGFGPDREPGERVISVFVYHPFDNCCDDIIYRIDF